MYSTCTLSPFQNDAVVQAALDKLWQENNVEVVVKDTSEFVQRFSDSFTFYDKCRYGQLVLPSLTANFGPAYFCKMERVR